MHALAAKVNMRHGEKPLVRELTVSGSIRQIGLRNPWYGTLSCTPYLLPDNVPLAHKTEYSSITVLFCSPAAHLCYYCPIGYRSTLGGQQ